MAEATLSFAVGKLGDLLIQKVDFLQGVEDKLKELKKELEWMQCFLKDASEKRAKDELIRKWISDIRDLAHDTEDAIDSFALRVDAPRKSRGLLGRCVCFPQHVYHLDKLGKEIESIRRRLKEIDTRRERYGITSSVDDEVGLSSSRRRDRVEKRRRVSPWQPDKHVVGLETHVDKLLKRSVFMGKEGLFVASIVGMGGVGKSTLAKKLYNHTVVVDGFECRAWITVSRVFRPKELLKEVMEKLIVELAEGKLKVLDIMEKSTEEGVKQMVYQHLQGKRYFMVVDDVWRQEHWEELKTAFPDEQDQISGHVG